MKKELSMNFIDSGKLASKARANKHLRNSNFLRQENKQPFDFCFRCKALDCDCKIKLK